ncbi:copper-binding protein [Burkholderia sp. AU19243]|uniref:RND transporter MFP subunit n=1 Tax=Burkholderia latens TaxID=488446 RepID=A0AAP1C5F0_9BURK|nr:MULTISPECIES: copper-binding protein [Burkholderia]AIO38983.1 copper binding periplasmic CusF family protein [Burkholderia cenocepacia]MBR8141667.1 copper-binding protein [Burkholderia vietnamiensis]AOK07696.1 RND transporter MFP subunit [Burkholderia latens]KVA04699.1 RND transporter MFP subunit [Burkholderia latens]MBR8362608.1 copper-binding protein [Burkholderia sp. AU19243]
MKIRCVAVAVLGMMAVALAMPVRAAGGMSDMNMGDMKASAPDAALTDAEVKRIDAVQRTLTLKHGPLANVGMGPMTMTFKAGDPAMIESLHAGDKVKVRIERVNGALTIVKLVKQR